MNPLSPLSPLNPSNPLSPLSPYNIDKHDNETTTVEVKPRTPEEIKQGEKVAVCIGITAFLLWVVLMVTAMKWND